MIDSSSFQTVGYIPLFFLSVVNQLALPAPVDLIMLAMVKLGFNPWVTVATAIFGMTLGSTADFILGKYGLRLIPWVRKEEKTKHFKRAEKFYRKYGLITLLFTWTPFVGKYLPFIAGAMKIHATTFYFFYLLGKLCYYGTLLLILKSTAIL